MPTHWYIPADDTVCRRFLRRPLRCAACGLAGAVVGLAASGQPREVQIQFEDVPDVAVDPAADDAIDQVRGFRFTQVDEDTAKLIDEFLAKLDEEAWEEAFKEYASLRDATRGQLTPVGDTGRYLPVQGLMAQRLAGLSAEGRAAFRLYFDAYAAERLAEVENHPEPGSYEQFKLARELFDWFGLTASGPRAGELLADMCFERGRFLEAASCWERVLTLHPGSRPEPAIQARRALALLRAGEVQAAQQLREGLAQRYGSANEQVVQLGGRRVSVNAFLAEHFGPGNPGAGDADAALAQDRPPAYAPIALPQPGTAPQWAYHIVTPAVAKKAQGSDQRHHWSPISTIQGLIPPIVIDHERVYGHWMGSVFALDLKSGKMLWQSQPVNQAVEIRARSQRGGYGTRDDYRIAQTDQCVLVVDASPMAGFGVFVLTAYDKRTGRVLWDTGSTLYDRGVCGQPLVHDGAIYVTTRPRDAAAGQLMLHRLDPTTGEAGWGVALGELDLQQSPYSGLSQSIQPVLEATERHVLVLTNNGGLLAVDAGAGEVSWAFRLSPPAHLEVDEPFIHARVPDQATMPDTTPGGMVVRGRTLYLKESLSRELYAIDLHDQRVVWTKRVGSIYAELDGAIHDQLVLVSNGVDLRGMDGQSGRELETNNIGAPGSNALAGEDALYLLTNGQIVRASTKPPYAVTRFQHDRLYHNEGGRLYAASGLLICASKSGLVAYPTPTRTVSTASTASTQDPAP